MFSISSDSCFESRTFSSQFLDGMTHEELKEYDVILNDHGNEWDMLAWASGNKVWLADTCMNKIIGAKELINVSMVRLSSPSSIAALVSLIGSGLYPMTSIIWNQILDVPAKRKVATCYKYSSN